MCGHRRPRRKRGGGAARGGRARDGSSQWLSGPKRQSLRSDGTSYSCLGWFRQRAAPPTHPAACRRAWVQHARYQQRTVCQCARRLKAATPCQSHGAAMEPLCASSAAGRGGGGGARAGVSARGGVTQRLERAGRVQCLGMWAAALGTEGATGKPIPSFLSAQLCSQRNSEQPGSARRSAPKAVARRLVMHGCREYRRASKRHAPCGVCECAATRPSPPACALVRGLPACSARLGGRRQTAGGGAMQ